MYQDLFNFLKVKGLENNNDVWHCLLYPQKPYWACLYHPKYSEQSYEDRYGKRGHVGIKKTRRNFDEKFFEIIAPYLRHIGTEKSRGKFDLYEVVDWTGFANVVKNKNV